MEKDTINYLNSYIEQLAKVRKQSEVYGELSDWHFNTKSRLVRAVQDMNGSFGLANGRELQPHIATTAIGELHEAIVIVSANPGHSDKPVARNPGKASKNAMEDAYRSASTERNAEFCQYFFKGYRQICGGSSPYWTKAMRFLEVYNTQARVGSTEELWVRASKAGGLGGLDLLPLHSTKDGITPFLHGPNADPLLRKVALATLGMAIRLSPKFLLVTSGPGQVLMTELLERADGSGPLAQATITRHPVDALPPFDLIRAWDVRTVDGGMTTIATFPYQIFSGNFAFIAQRIGYSDAGFVSEIKKLVKRNRGRP